MSETPERAPEDRGDDAAYWAYIERIEEEAWKLAHDIVTGREPEAEDALTAACMMIYAAFEQQKILLAQISAGHVRRNAADWSQAGKAQREAL